MAATVESAGAVGGNAAGGRRILCVGRVGRLVGRLSTVIGGRWCGRTVGGSAACLEWNHGGAGGKAVPWADWSQAGLIAGNNRGSSATAPLERTGELEQAVAGHAGTQVQWLADGAGGNGGTGSGGGVYLFGGSVTLTQWHSQ